MPDPASNSQIDGLKTLLNNNSLNPDDAAAANSLINNYNSGASTTSDVNSFYSNLIIQGKVNNPSASNTAPVDDTPDTPQDTNIGLNKNSVPPATDSNATTPNVTNSDGTTSPGQTSTGSSTGTYDPTQQATSDSSGNPTSTYNPTTSAPIYSCGNNAMGDKRLKVFRTHDKVLWFFWVDFVVGSGSYTDNSKNPLQFNIQDPNSKAFIKTDPIQEEDSILFYTKTSDESFTLPTDKMGTLTKSVLWATYYDKKSNLYKAIKGAKYFDMHYDIDTHELDLVFWANVNVDDIGVKGKDLYDSIRSPVIASGDIDPKSQRVVFYAKGQYKTVYCNRSVTGTDLVAMGMFIFGKPRLLLVPGQKKGSQADCVVDESVGLGFLEFTG